MTEDLFDGDGPIPTAFWRLPDTLPLTVRHRDSTIPRLPDLAFAVEFDRSLSVYGSRYISLSMMTRFDARTGQPSPRRTAYEALTAAYPGTFTTVIGRNGPEAVWLALLIQRLTDQVADAILRHHHPIETKAP